MVSLAFVTGLIAIWLTIEAGSEQLRRLEGEQRAHLPNLVVGRPDALNRTTRYLWATLSAVTIVIFLDRWWSIFPALALGFGSYILTGQIISPAIKKERASLIEQLPQTLDFLAAALEAGAPLERAVIRISAVSPQPTRRFLTQINAYCQIGSTNQEVWRKLPKDHPWGVVARDIVRASRSGAALVEALRNHAGDARRRRRGLLELKAKKVGVKAAMPLMICFLPAFLMLGVAPTVISLLMDSLRL